jgi:hypothetical protein
MMWYPEVHSNKQMQGGFGELGSSRSEVTKNAFRKDREKSATQRLG